MANSKVIIHVGKGFAENLYSSPHLASAAWIRDLVLSQGGEVEVRERIQSPCGSNGSDKTELRGPKELHIIQGGSMRSGQTLNTALAYISPFFYLSKNGIQSNGAAVDTDFHPNDIDRNAADKFWDELQNKLVSTRRSRYPQADEVIEIPTDAIAVFLQGSVPENEGTAHCTAETMLRTVARHAGQRPVVVKAHPLSNLERQFELIHKLISEGLNLTPVDANIHDILKACSVTVSMNSAVSVEGMLHNKPSILFGKSDFHHVCETVRSPDEFPSALSAALKSSHDYAAFLYWYFHTFCLSLEHPDLKQKVLQIFFDMGFDAERLGLHTNEPNNEIRKERQAKAAIKSITKTLNSKPEITSFERLKPLKAADKNWVFSAIVNDKKVVVKRFFDRNPARTVGTLKAELEFASAHLGDGPYQVNRCLMDWPEDGMVVLTHAPGLRLQDKIAKSSGGQRKKLFRQSGEWLRLYTTPRRRTASFNHKFWIEKLREKPSPDDMLLEDKALVSDLVDCLDKQHERVHFCPIIHAASHGDFAGVNAHYHSGVVYGVDIQGECWVPFAKEVARFLVWQQLHDIRETSEFRYGIDKDDMDAFLKSDVLDAAEQQTTLPFFIGVELHGRFTSNFSSPSFRLLARRAIKAYVAEHWRL